MRSNYKKLGQYIRQVDIRNQEDKKDNLLGVSTQKIFIESIANTVGTDFTKYKIVKKYQFTYVPDTSRRGDKIGLAMLEHINEGLVSQAYTVFEIIDVNELDPEYLMMWFRRPEFDRYARFKSHGSVREIFGWDEMCDVELPVPPIEKQREIVKEYNTIVNRIKLNEQLNQKLEETAQSIYKQWFVDFEFPISEEYAKSINRPDLIGKPYKSNGGEMIFNEELEQEIPKGWELNFLSKIANITMGQSPSGESYNQNQNGILFYQGRTEFGFRYPGIKNYTTEPKRMASKNDILMSVRAPVGDINIAAEDCCIGRGLAAIKSKHKKNSFLFYLLQHIKPMLDISNDEGTVFGSINKDSLNELQILKPKDITINLFNEIISKIDGKIFFKCSEVNILLQTKELLLSSMASKQLEAVS